ncbi:MAG: GntR family transcriptional regulator [Firmicutes bacterium]|nr:GntR family transcriptional regulator [[Eubacterium] siraeum]MCM1486979.1 GntR family transcriptional regulator [Bacillota bacterium]
MITVDYKDKRPLYEQLAGNITEMALSGELKPHEQLPSVRQLAVSMGINPNTIARAYGELERRGVIYSVLGKGSYINDDLSFVIKERTRKTEEKLRTAVKEAKSGGVTKERIQEIVGEEYD